MGGLAGAGDGPAAAASLRERRPLAGDDLSGPRLLQPDRVHPTERGQLLPADRAATALGVTPSPSSLAAAPVGSGRWAYHREAAGQSPRRALKRILRRPTYRDPRES